MWRLIAAHRKRAGRDANFERGNMKSRSIEATNTSRWFAARRRALAVKYNENMQTTVNMSGTAITPRAIGKAVVEFEHGRAKVKLEMENLDHPQSLGGFYTTYILWAVAPEEQTEKLMELPIRSKFKIESAPKFRTFGLIITAEPHSEVELPSSMIVVENILHKEMEGLIPTSEIEYSGDPGTFYVIFSPNSPAPNADYDTPLMILGARRAVEIAQRADARIFAEAELRDAELKLATLEQAWLRSRGASDLPNNVKNNGGLAHDVMRVAERARKLSVERRCQTQSKQGLF
jgi:hypothetical protein